MHIIKATTCENAEMRGTRMNYEELKRLFAACRKLGIEKAKDLEQFKRKNKCLTNKELLDALERRTNA